jgi:prepilin-type N-terminal cleavage/methylation domain-containing protein
MSFSEVDPLRMKGCCRCRSVTGFTVLEMLVVLVVVGLIAASLFEGVGRLKDMSGRLGPFLAKSERDQLTNLWFRQSINGAWPDRKDGAHLFVGSGTEFSGLTLAPLNEYPGRPTEFKWQLVYDSLRDQTALVYTGFGPQALEVRQWRGSRINFSYLAPDLTWHDAWPPGIEQAAQLPVAVRLFAEDDHVVVVAAVKRATDPLPEGKGVLLAR